MVKEKPIPAGDSFPQRLAPPESRPKMEPLATSAQPPLPLLPHQRSPHAPPPRPEVPQPELWVEQSPRQSPGWPLAGEALPDAGLGSCTDPGSNPGSASYQLRDPDESLKGPKPLLPTLERASWAVVWMQCVDTSSGGPRVGHPWEQPAWGWARVCSLEGISKQ